MAESNPTDDLSAKMGAVSINASIVKKKQRDKKQIYGIDETVRRLLTQPNVNEFIKTKKRETEKRIQLPSRQDYLEDLLKKNDNVMLDELHDVCSSRVDADFKDQTTAVLKSMLCCMWDWLIGLRSLGVPSAALDDCIDHMAWTEDGFPDELRTMRSLLEANKLPENCNTFVILCALCLEELIRELRPKIQLETSSRGHMSVAYWLHKLGESCSHCEQISCRYQNFEGRLLESAIFTGNFPACEYFGQFVDEVEKQRAFYNYFRPSSPSIHFSTGQARCYMSFLGKLNGDDKRKFFKILLCNFHLFSAIAESADWSIIWMIKNGQIDLDFEDCDNFLIDVAYLMTMTNFQVHRKIWLRTFKDFWQCLVPECKKTINIYEIFNGFARKVEVIGSFLVSDPALVERWDELRAELDERLFFL